MSSDGRGWELPEPYLCSQEPHPGIEFYGPDGSCAECGYAPDQCHDKCVRLVCEWCPGHDLAYEVNAAIREAAS